MPDTTQLPGPQRTNAAKRLRRCAAPGTNPFQPPPDTGAIPGRRGFLPSFSQSYRNIVLVAFRGKSAEGGSIVASTPVCCAWDSIADRGCFRPFVGHGCTGPGSIHLRGCGRDRGPALADHAVEGRAVARHLRSRETARGRTV